jgi:hypothetical protein
MIHLHPERTSSERKECMNTLAQQALKVFIFCIHGIRASNWR